MIGGDVGHEFVALVKALPPVGADRECDGVGEIGGSAGLRLSCMASEDKQT
jgi:hypothetical protein